MPAHQAISLHCTAGGSDKVYHIQLVSSGTTWSVLAQSGKRGSRLIERNKLLGATYMAAMACYEALIEEKIKVKNYVSVALSPTSAAALASTPAVPPAQPEPPLPPLPAWPDLATRYAEIATLLKEPSTLKTQPQAHIVLLVDMSDGAEGGLPDAVALVNKATRMPSVSARNGVITSLLSAEGLLWFNAIDAPQQSSALNILKGSCAQLVKVL